MKLELNAAEIQRFLGQPARRSMTHSSGSDITHRSTWACGCALDRVGHADTTADWTRCATHAEIDRALAMRLDVLL